jgi:phosphate acetyltransferase
LAPLYVTALEARSGKSVVALGMVEMLSAKVGGVGFFRPVVPVRPDPQVELIRTRFGLGDSGDPMCALDEEEAGALLAAGDHDALIKRTIEAYKALEPLYEVIVCEGTDIAGGLDLDLNAELAQQLGAPVLAVVAADGEADAPRGVRIARESLERRGCTVFGVIVNRAPPAQMDSIALSLMAADAREPVYVLPEHPDLAQPTVAEVAAALDARVLSDPSASLNREVRGVRIAAMSVANFIEDLTDDTLVIVPADRPEIVIASLASALSVSFPSVAGVVLTGGYELGAGVRRLIETAPFPVLASDHATYEAANALGAVNPTIAPDDERKIATALGVFEAGVDTGELTRRIAAPRAHRKTPLMFEYELIEHAKALPRHIVLPEGGDERVLRATEVLLRRGVADLTLLGRPAEIRSAAATLGLDIAAAQIVDPDDSPLRDDFAARYHELRASKGITEERAYETMGDVTYFGTMMVRAGVADGMVSGAVHTTGDTVRPAFEFIRARKGVRVISSVFFMCLPDQVLVYGDCAVNPRPDPKQLADIAISSVETAKLFGIDPRVAMLSYSTGESARGPDVTMVREATQHVRDRRPDLLIEGPIQYDAAVDPDVARLKMPGSDVAGRATVFIFPDLDTGNVAYKAVQRSSDAVAIGPVLQGLNHPINDLSRGCNVTDIVNTVAVTAVQAQQGVVGRGDRGRSLVLEQLRVPRGASIAGAPVTPA